MTATSMSAPAAAVSVASSAKAQDYARAPTVAVAVDAVAVSSIPIIIVVVIRGVGNTATMANTIAIDPVAMPESTIMHSDDRRGIAADDISFVEVKICCRSRVREGH
jgi:hypothetical protein